MSDSRRFVQYSILILVSMLLIVSGSWVSMPATAGPMTWEDTGKPIRYQGLLKAEDGQPVADGDYDFRLALYEAVSGGVALWTAVQNDVPVQDGVFSVTLDRATFLAEGNGSKDRYLAVSVRGPRDDAFTDLEPRQYLDSAAATLAQPSCTSPSADHDHCGDARTCSSATGLTIDSGAYIAFHGINYSNAGDPVIWGDARGADEGIGVKGTGRLNGVRGENNSGEEFVYGVYGEVTGSGRNRGVYGITESTTDDAIGVKGVADASSGRTMGVLGMTMSTSQNAAGVYASANSTTGDVKGLIAESYSQDAGVAIAGLSRGDRHAGWFETGNFVAMNIQNNSATFETLSLANLGGGPTARLWGDVQVVGDIQVSGGGSTIDHPLDPAGKYLQHAMVESPTRMNIYNGNVQLDEQGEAVVELPDYFEALNQEFRYQLTPIGAPAPELYIAEGISDNRFKIAGGPAGLTVSWQITGVRHDAWAQAHPVQVEQEKSAQEQGFYQYPELHSQPDRAALEQLHVIQETMLTSEPAQAPPIK